MHVKINCGLSRYVTVLTEKINYNRSIVFIQYFLELGSVLPPLSQHSVKLQWPYVYISRSHWLIEVVINDF